MVVLPEVLDELTNMLLDVSNPRVRFCPAYDLYGKVNGYWVMVEPPRLRTWVERTITPPVIPRW